MGWGLGWDMGWDEGWNMEWDGIQGGGALWKDGGSMQCGRAAEGSKGL